MGITDLRHYIRTYEADLEPAFCQRMIDSFNALHRYHQPNGRGHRAGLEGSAWTELNVTGLSDESFLGFFRARIDLALDRYNREVGLDIAVPNSAKTADLIMKRYRPAADEQFQQHFDSIHEVANRYLVLFWYLNDVAEGGETIFPSSTSGSPRGRDECWCSLRTGCSSTLACRRCPAKNTFFRVTCCSEFHAS